MPKQLLDGADTCPEPQVLDIVAIFEKMGGKAVAEGMASDRLIHSGLAGSLFDRFLEAGFIQMMALHEAADRVDGEFFCRENILPGKLTPGVGIFPVEGVGEVDGTATQGKVLIVQEADLLQMQPQRLEKAIGKLCDPVILSLPVPNDDLAVCKVEILEVQAHDFHKTQPAAVHQLGHTCTCMQVQV